MEKETCQNCTHYKGCMKHSGAIFLLYIVTGRDRQVPEVRDKLNIRLSCTTWERAASEPVDSGQ